MNTQYRDYSVFLHKWRTQGDPLICEALEEAFRLRHSYLGVEHLFIAMTKVDGKTQQILRSLSMDPTQVRDALRREMGCGKSQSNPDAITPRLLKIIDTAKVGIPEGKSLLESQLLFAMLEEGNSLPIRFLQDRGFDPKAAYEGLMNLESSADADKTMVPEDPEAAMATMIPGGEAMLVPEKQPSQNEQTRIGAPIKPQPAIPVSLPTPTLDLHGRDLTKLARLGKLADAIGRETEINQMITILARTQKANPILLGDAGVGKTAIVEGLAWRINQAQVPPVLRGKRIVEIQMSSLTAGTSLRGQFEERIRAMVKEATEAPEVILFIDEIHTLVGAGSSSDGSNDAAQMMKPALARGDISCIGATTQDEFTRFIRKDPALERRFSPVTIKELTPEATFLVLEKVLPKILEKQAVAGYRLEVAPDALRAAIALTDKYVKDRNQPDKSIDALDIACARAIVHDKMNISAADIADVVSEWTGIPAGKLTQDDKNRYARMEEALGRRVKGQDAAISALSRTLRTALAGLKAPNRPVGVFLFMGPSGVGKTMLAKELAAFLFGSDDALIRFDMSEFQEKHKVSNLIGASRGYVDSEKGGALTEALRRNPYSVVLLDEIEKAHPDVFNIFLSVFDDGRLTDNQGRTIDCSNAVFIMTSNLGAGEIDFSDIGPSGLREKASKFLRPELVNRINEVIGFLPLGTNELEAIIDGLLLEKARNFQASQNLNLEFDVTIKQVLLARGFDPRMGARPVERAVDQMIVQPVVDAIFRGELSGKVQVAFGDGQVIFNSEGK